MMNFLAIIVAAIAGMIIGAVWYSPMMFAKHWMSAAGIDNKKMGSMKKEGGMWMYYLIAFIMMLVFSYMLSWVINIFSIASVAGGIIVALMLWLGFIVTTQINPVLWERRPMKLYWISIAHYLVAMLVMGIILGAWR